MVFEGMEESGSIGLEAVVIEEAKDFLKDVDAVCISDNYWLGTTSPCLSKFSFLKIIDFSRDTLTFLSLFTQLMDLEV